jgi:hypothetical protein
VVHETLGRVVLSAELGDIRVFDKLEVRRHGRP